MRPRSLIVLITAVVTVAYVGSVAMRHQAIRSGGDALYLELAPVDPLSLFQGQYMTVNFALERESHDRGAVPADGNGDVLAVVELDGRKVGTVREFVAKEQAEFSRQGLNEKYGIGSYALLGVRLIPTPHESTTCRIEMWQKQFMFMENTEDLYDNARFGFFKVTADGQYQLVDLADEHLKLLTPSDR